MLIATLDPIPDCTDANKIMDIWSHPFLQEKHKDVICNVHFSTPAHKVIQSGPLAPVHVHKNLAIFTLRINNTPAIPLVIPWNDHTFQVQYTCSLWIDTPASNRWMVYHLLPTMSLPGIANIDRPKPSRGSTPKEEHSTIKIHFHGGVGSQLQQFGVLRFLKTQLQAFSCIIGIQDSICDNHTKLLDIPSPQAIAKVLHLTKGVIIISPKLAIVDTGANADQWRMALTQAWKDDPTNAPSRIRYRPSHPNKQKCFATIAATQEQIQATKARGQHNEIAPNKSNPETLRVNITANVDATGNLEEWLPKLISEISTRSNIPLQPQVDPDGLNWHSWKPLFNFEGSWTGNVIVQLESKEEMTNLAKAIKGTTLNIHGHTTPLRISSPFVDM
jgi:hypothetical protein